VEARSTEQGCMFMCDGGSPQKQEKKEELHIISWRSICCYYFLYISLTVREHENEACQDCPALWRGMERPPSIPLFPSFSRNSAFYASSEKRACYGMVRTYEIQ
jgi:hypothetical protein